MKSRGGSSPSQPGRGRRARGGRRQRRRCADGRERRATATTLRIWVDNDHKAAVDRDRVAWGAATRRRRRGREEGLREDPRRPEDRRGGERARRDRRRRTTGSGELAANGLVLPLTLRATTRSQFPSYALDAFSYGTAVKRTYGVPVALENVGLVVNTRLAGCRGASPTSRRRRSRSRRRRAATSPSPSRRARAATRTTCTRSSPGSCGYVFGKNRAGNLDASDIGLDNRGSSERAADRPLEPDRAHQLEDRLRHRQGRLPEGQGRPTGSRARGSRHAQAEQAQLPDRPGAEEQVQVGAVPGRPGLHGHEVLLGPRRRDAGEGSRRQLHGRTAAQTALAGANGRYPANSNAGKRVKDAVLHQFGRAGAGGVPMPNIPQMASVWTELGGAWVKSTRGSGATKARAAFVDRRPQHRQQDRLISRDARMRAPADGRPPLTLP